MTTCRISVPKWQPIKRASSWWGSSLGSMVWKWCRPTWAIFRWVWEQVHWGSAEPFSGQPGYSDGGIGVADSSRCQENAELAVRDMLRAFGTSRQVQGLPLEVSAEDHMDDGSPIRLRVQINLSQVRTIREGLSGLRGLAGSGLLTSPLSCLSSLQGSAVFDFSGTGPEVFGNLNAPRAITLSALIYCLRCLVGRDIPLNQVCRDVVCGGGPYQGKVTPN